MNITSSMQITVASVKITDASVSRFLKELSEKIKTTAIPYEEAEALENGLVKS